MECSLCEVKLGISFSEIMFGYMFVMADVLFSEFSENYSRYKESFSKSTRAWREKFFSRNTPMADLCPEVRREENEGINRITHGMEQLEARENTGAGIASGSTDDSANGSVVNTINQRIADNPGNVPLSHGNASVSHAAACFPTR